MSHLYCLSNKNRFKNSYQDRLSAGLSCWEERTDLIPKKLKNCSLPPSNQVIESRIVQGKVILSWINYEDKWLITYDSFQYHLIFRTINVTMNRYRCCWWQLALLGQTKVWNKWSVRKSKNNFVRWNRDSSLFCFDCCPLLCSSGPFSKIFQSHFFDYTLSQGTCNIEWTKLILWFL